MLKLILTFMLINTLYVTASYASETVSNSTAPGENKVKTSDFLINKKFEEDKEITDAKIKADSGSLSEYSLKFNLSYYGAGITDLNNPNQPNPDGTVCACETALSGSMSARYRIDKKSSIGFGSGINATTPIQGVKRWDVKNPFLSYDLTSKISQFQVRNSVSASYITNVIYRNVGEYAGVGYDNSVVYYFNQLSSLAVGFDTSFSYYLFERGYDKKDGKTNRYSLSFYPNIKYNFSDKLNVYSSLALSFWNPRYTTDETVMLNKALSQRLGFGYAYARDIYISPYLNFYPKDFQTDSTTINLSTTFSVL